MNIKEIIAVTIADVDVFLLKTEDQTKDKIQTFTTEEIRQQLEKSCKKIVKCLEECGYNIDFQLPLNNLPTMDNEALKERLAFIQKNNTYP